MPLGLGTTVLRLPRTLRTVKLAAALPVMPRQRHWATEPTMGDILGVIPKTGAEHQKRIGRAMFVAANVEILGSLLVIIVVSILIVHFVGRRKRA
jgi:hypothetical protein